MIPGMTTSPSASIVFRAPESRPMSVITPSLMPTSALRRGSPLPSTTVPPLMIVSKLIGILRSRSWAAPFHGPADVLELAVAAERPAAAVTAEPRELVAPEGGVGVEWGAVHLHGAGADRPRDAEPALRVAGPDVAVE